MLATLSLPALCFGQAQTLILDATLNGKHSDQLLTITRETNGAFRARAAELTELRLRIDPSKVVNGTIDLAQLEGLTYRYDEAHQAIELHAPDSLLYSFEVGMGTGRERVDVSAIHASPGATLNYGLYGMTTGNQTWSSGTGLGTVMTPAGNFFSSGVFNTQRPFDGSAGVRLDSGWRIDDAEAIRSYTVGDFASNALSWTNSTHLGGLQIASDFQQRSDLITTPLPQFSGSAALPSTLDVYVDQQRVFSGDIPAGPFVIRTLPYVQGGDVRLVTTDDTGRQITISQSYYCLPGQLKQGLLEYSLDLGFPRQDYGMRSMSYDDVISATGSVRYGVSDATTFEGHFETSADDLLNGGAGLVQSIGSAGAITASADESAYRGRVGTSYAVQLDGYWSAIRFFAGTQRATLGYFDLARVETLRTASALGIPEAAIAGAAVSTALAQKVDRAGLSFTPWFDRTTFNLSYNAIDSAGIVQRMVNLTLSRSLTSQVSAYASVYSSTGGAGNYGLSANINVRLGPKATLTTGIDHENGQSASTMQIDGIAGERAGDVGWGVLDREVFEGSGAQRSAYVTYRADDALLRADVEESAAQTRGELDVEGSVVALGGGVFLAGRLGDGFVVVENAGPGSGIMQGGVAMGNANADGRFLLPMVPPFYAQHVFVDPTTTADGWELPATEVVAVTGYHQGTIVDFGAARLHAAILVLTDKSGKPLPLGAKVALDGGRESAVIGYDGEAYLRGLGEHNRVSVELPAAAACMAAFDYDVHSAGISKIGPIVCR
jgi:outer membrane usher protein